MIIVINIDFYKKICFNFIYIKGATFTPNVHIRSFMEDSMSNTIITGSEPTQTAKIAVVGLSFGCRGIQLRPTNDDPVHVDLAQAGDAFAESMKAPRLYQWEIADQATGKIDLCVERNGMKYLDTRQVLVATKKWCDKHDITDVILVCASHHQWRVKLSAKKIGFNVIGVRTIANQWDPLSEQWWTRGPKRFWIREVPTFVYYFLRGWI